ncbi:hypothetical protein NHQ30_004611 [Ciborinia camelliae]|nr:hypothetical protein NHQ30_004611 [Ciborinia camelliae]
MEFYKLFPFFLVMILAFAQDAVGDWDSSPVRASFVTATKTIVGAFGSELYSTIKKDTSTSAPTGVSFDGLQLAKSTVYSTKIVNVSCTNAITTTILPHSTSTDVVTVKLTSTEFYKSTNISIELSTVTTITTASSISSSIATGLCYLSAQDALTPCTAGVLVTTTSSGSSKSSGSAITSALVSSGVMRHNPHGVFKALASIKRHVIGTNHHEKRDTDCDGWQASLIITALSIAFTLISILVFATFLREKREEFPRVFAYRWWVYGGQSCFLVLLVWLIAWSAMKTVNNGCN